MNDLNAFIKNVEKEAKFLRFSAGDELTLLYKGYRVVPNKFAPDKDTVRYIFDVDGAEKFWENGNILVARSFEGIKEGATVCIKATASDRMNPKTGDPYLDFAVENVA